MSFGRQTGNWCCTLIMLGATLWAGTAAAADDRADLDRTNIIGNRELPKVLYIVPWKKPGPGDLSGMPAESVLDEALAPIDRDVFRRQVRYDRQLREGPATGQPHTLAPEAASAAAHEK